MPKVITFSTTFPANTLFAGAPTFFVDKIKSGKKIHTIRKGNRWKEGDLFSPRIWSGRPYMSKQVEILDPLYVVKTYTIRVSKKGWIINGKKADNDLIHLIAENDGLNSFQLFDWLQPNSLIGVPFEGQIICWGDPGYKI